MKNTVAVLPLHLVAAWLTDRGYRESYRTLLAKLSRPLCPIKLRTWSPGRVNRPVPAIAERDLGRLVAALGLKPSRTSQLALPL
jgi:hypothetical protein